VAVDESDRIYIWDQARLRVVVYEGGRYLRALPIPFVEREATAMLVEAGRIYLHVSGVVEYEIDASTGTLLRVATPSDPSIYPRTRGGRSGMPSERFGRDGAGLEYRLSSVMHPARYERVNPAGQVLAHAAEPLPEKAVDAYVRRDGALYELAADFGGQGSVYVYALLGPSTSPQAAPPSGARPVPNALGRPLPDHLTARLAGVGSVDLDAQSRGAVWWLASLARERSDLLVAPRNPLFVARWNDGSRLEIFASEGLLFADGTTYLGPARSYEQLAAYALAAPARLAEVAAGGATIRIADLADVQRVLTSAEIAQLRDSLARGFAVAEGELPGFLEPPFPTYEVVFGETVVSLRGDHYGAVGRLGAFAHDGTLDDLARRWLPVPDLSIEDVRSLFFADKVTFEQRQYSELQDITRWKATIVRGLTGIGPEIQPDPPGEPPAMFTFELAGRSEKVEVRPGSFTYRGRVYARPGVMNLVYLRGVP
jgi:hypothetical protein